MEQSREAGRKDDSGKLRYDLIKPSWLEGLASVITHGAEKYGDENWVEVPNGNARYYAAAMRHIQAIRGDVLLDEDSGLPHIYHAITSLLMMHELHNY